MLVLDARKQLANAQSCQISTQNANHYLRTFYKIRSLRSHTIKNRIATP